MFLQQNISDVTFSHLTNFISEATKHILKRFYPTVNMHGNTELPVDNLITLCQWMIWCSTITDSYNTADTKDPLEGIHYQFHTPNTTKFTGLIFISVLFAHPLGFPSENFQRYCPKNSVHIPHLVIPHTCPAHNSILNFTIPMILGDW